MTTTSFLARKTLGQPRYLLVAMACVFALALIPAGAKRALDSSANNPERWLSADVPEVQDLAWFRDHFRGEQFAVVSWDGCTLGNSERLELLARKLAPSAGAAARLGATAQEAARAHWYSRVTTGPQVIRDMMKSQVGLTNTGAIKRLEGALVGPPQRDPAGRTLGNESRATCMIVALSPEAMSSNQSMRAAIEAIPAIAASECGIDAATIHMGGAPVDNATIDAEGRRTIVTLAAVVGLLTIGLCYWRLGSVRLTAIVITIGAASAGLSLAVVAYFGAFEMLMLGRTAPVWGGLDVVLMAMPAIVYLLAISAALHLANYYRHAQLESGLATPGAAAEEAVRMGWRPAAITAVATIAGLATLAASDVAPLQKFGAFTAVAIAGALVLVFGVAPVLLHRYPIGMATRQRRRGPYAMGDAPRRTSGLVQFAVHHYGLTLALAAVALVGVAAGMAKLDAHVQVLKLLNRNSDLVQDYAWLEQHIGNVVPLEVVVTMPTERLRTGDEHAEEDGQQYRLTMLERLELLRQIARRLEAFPQLGQAMSAATFAPPATVTGLDAANRGGDYAKNKELEYHRERLLDGDYVRMEHAAGSDRLTGRELWRLNLRVAALPAAEAAVDYGQLLAQVQQAVEPVLWSYQQRDIIVRALHEQGKQLAGAKVRILFRAPKSAMAPSADVQEYALAELLRASGVAARDVTYLNLATFEQPEMGDKGRDEAARNAALESLAAQDAVILASAPHDPVVAKIAGSGVYVVNVTDMPDAVETTASALADDGGPRPIRAVYTGTAPVVNRAQRQLIGNLNLALWRTASVVGVVITIGTMSVPAGALALIPCLLPLATVFGAMGWLGLKLDLGVAMSAAIALGVAIEGAMHFINWFQRGLTDGLSRFEAVESAYHNCGYAMIETAAIASLGMSVLAFSSFTPFRELALLMVATLGMSLVANLIVLPAMLASPLGWFFAPLAMRRLDPFWAKVQARFAARGAAAEAFERDDAKLLRLPQAAPLGPHYEETPSSAPAPTRRTILAVGAEERREMAEGPHGALHAKLQGLRRPRTGDSATS